MGILLTYNEYTVKVFEDTTFSENSSDNIRNYDQVIRLDADSYTVSKHGIEVVKEEELAASTILLGAGGGTGVHENGFLINNDRIYCCAGNAVYCLGLPELQLIWKTKVDDVTAFGIFEMRDDFLIHGELSISRLDSNGGLVWQNYGSDIFVLPSGNDCFFLGNDGTISAESWDGRKYHFDYDGNMLE